MQMNRRFSTYEEFSHQFSRCWLFHLSSFLIADVNPTRFLVTFWLRNMD